MKPEATCSRRGTAVLELAVASCLLVPLVLGTLQTGYKYFVYDLLSAEVRDAARFASRRTFRCADAASIARFKTEVANIARFGNPQGTGELLEPGLTADQIQVEIKGRNGAGAGPANAPVSVIVSANYTLDALHKKIVFDRKPILQFPYIGQFAPAESEPGASSPKK